MLLWTELTKYTAIILMGNCKQAICLGLPILFPYAQVYKIWIFRKFDFPLEAFSHNFQIDSIPGNHPSILNNVLLY